MDDLQLPTYMFFLFTNHHDDSDTIYQNKLIFGRKKNNIEVKSLDQIGR